MLFSLINSGIVCNLVLTISRGKVTELRRAIPTNARACFSMNLALLSSTVISIAVIINGF